MEFIPNEILLNILSHVGKKDLLVFRFINSRWNEISTELLGQKIKISLITRMETKSFMEIVRQRTGNSIFNALQLSLDSIPANVLQELALLLNESSHKLRIHLIQITVSCASYPTPSPCVKALVTLQYLSNVTFLHIQRSANLYVEVILDQMAIQELEANLPVFRFLTKIIWNTDTKLLFSIIRRAPMLQLLQINGIFGNPTFITKLPEIVERLPLNATLQTDLQFYFKPEVLRVLTQMRYVPNKISILTLVGFSSDIEDTNTKRIWYQIITQFLASQSGSLKILSITGTKEFQLPELLYLEKLTIKSTLPDSGFNPSMFPRLKEVTVSSNQEVVKLFAQHSWPNVCILHIEPESSQLVTCFPKLEKLTTFWDTIRFELIGSQDTMDVKDFFPAYTFGYTSVTFGPCRVCVPSLKNFGNDQSKRTPDLRELRVLQCPIKILEALVHATREGNLKLHKLEVEVLFLEPVECDKYLDTLSKYHDIVILRTTKEDDDW